MDNYLIDDTLEKINYLLQKTNDKEERSGFLQLKISLYSIKSILQLSLNSEEINLVLFRLFIITAITSSKIEKYTNSVII